MRYLLALGAILLFCAPAAAVSVSVTTQPTPDVPGYITYTLTAESDSGPISGFDFAGDGSLGFFGPMNQINPAGSATVFFQDLFHPFITYPHERDSHFTFFTGTSLAVNRSESDTHLQASLALGGAFGQGNEIAEQLTFAQIVVPVDGAVSFSGNFTVLTSDGPVIESVSGILQVPEPGSALLILIGLGGLSATRTRLVR